MLSALVAVLLEIVLVWYRRKEHVSISVIIFMYIALNIILSISLVYATIFRREPIDFEDRSKMGQLAPYALSIDIMTGVGIGQVIPNGQLVGSMVSINELLSWFLTTLLNSMLIKIVVAVSNVKYSLA